MRLNNYADKEHNGPKQYKGVYTPEHPTDSYLKLTVPETEKLL